MPRPNKTKRIKNCKHCRAPKAYYFRDGFYWCGKGCYRAAKEAA